MNKFRDYIKDKEGKIVIFQRPSLPLIFAIIFALAQVAAGSSSLLLTIGFLLSLTVWAVLELINGVNLFRRLLGAAALIYLAAAY